MEMGKHIRCWSPFGALLSNSVYEGPSVNDIAVDDKRQDYKTTSTSARNVIRGTHYFAPYDQKQINALADKNTTDATVLSVLYVYYSQKICEALSSHE